MDADRLIFKLLYSVFLMSVVYEKPGFLERTGFYKKFLLSVVYEKPGFLERTGFYKKFLYLPNAEKRYSWEIERFFIASCQWFGIVLLRQREPVKSLFLLLNRQWFLILLRSDQ